MTAILEAVRPQVCLAAAAVSLLGTHLSGSSTRGASAWVAALVVLLIVGTCNVVNDIVDLDTDSLNRPHRPLPSGRLGIRAASISAAVLAAGGLLLAASLGVGPLVAAAIFLAAGIAYSIVVREVTLLGHVWVAAIFGATTLWGGWTAEGVTKAVWAAAILVSLFLLPRELLKSLGDAPGDRLAGWRTAAVVLGAERTMWAVGATVAGFALATLVPPMVDIGGLPYLAVMWLATVVPLAAVVVWLWRDIENRVRRGELVTALLWFPGLTALWLLVPAG